MNLFRFTFWRSASNWRMSRVWLLALLIGGGVSPGQAQGAASNRPPESTPASGFAVRQVADGVYALIRKEPLGLWFESNVIFIINANDVLVVDTNISLAAAREAVAALRALTSKPVRYVVNTHWHEDHLIGNQIWRAAYPDVEFIGHASTLTDWPVTGANNRRQAIKGGPGLAKMLRTQLEKNESLAGGELTAEERAGYAETVRLVERYGNEAPNFEIILPTLTVADKLTLQRGPRVIEIRHLGRAHTAADLIVFLPNEKLVLSGDLIVWPIPLIGSTSYPADYVATLEKLLALNPSTIVPGHGPVLRDDAYVKLMLRLLTSINQQVAAAVARGETLEQTRKSVDLTELRKAFAGDSKLKAFVFANYVTGPAVEAAYRQATEQH
jgi:glyoxylase-like metal-dependent hydrolase (beta-lactamase superfamily II)